jgi:hypothetical protein
MPDTGSVHTALDLEGGFEYLSGSISPPARRMARNPISAHQTHKERLPNHRAAFHRCLPDRDELARSMWASRPPICRQ